MISGVREMPAGGAFPTVGPSSAKVLVRGCLGTARRPVSGRGPAGVSEGLEDSGDQGMPVMPASGGGQEVDGREEGAGAGGGCGTGPSWRSWVL